MVKGSGPFADALRPHVIVRGHVLVSNVSDADVVWFVDTLPMIDGRPDERALEDLLMDMYRLSFWAQQDAVFLVSTEWPVGTLRSIQYLVQHPLTYVMENVTRAGEGMEGPWIAGGENVPVTTLLQLLGGSVMCLSAESAEMTKHALNTFLALQISFANEIDALSEKVNASSTEVLTALKSDPRVGAKAYLLPGAPVSSPCLWRDVSIVEGLLAKHNLTLPVLSAIRRSNGR